MSIVVRLAVLLLTLGFSASAARSGDDGLDRFEKQSGQPRLCIAEDAAGALADLSWHADCGMGRHCEEGTRCCVTSETFWCCPTQSRCDYDQPGQCKAPD